MHGPVKEPKNPLTCWIQPLQWVSPTLPALSPPVPIFIHARPIQKRSRSTFSRQGGEIRRKEGIFRPGRTDSGGSAGQRAAAVAPCAPALRASASGPARGLARGCAPCRWPRARPLPAPAAPRAPDSFAGGRAPRRRTHAPLAAPAVRPAPRTGGPARTRFLHWRPRSIPRPGCAPRAPHWRPRARAIPSPAAALRAAPWPCALPAVRMPIFRRKTTGFRRKMDFQICEPFPSGFHWNPADSA